MKPVASPHKWKLQKHSILVISHVTLRSIHYPGHVAFLFSLPWDNLRYFPPFLQDILEKKLDVYGHANWLGRAKWMLILRLGC
jgi:hypothetical protein